MDITEDLDQSLASILNSSIVHFAASEVNPETEEPMEWTSAHPDEVGSKEMFIQVTSNHLILKEVFRNLLVPDLLQCSLVSKLWCLHARTVLRQYKKCLVSIKPEKSCLHLQNFVSQVLQTVTKTKADLPFNGLSILTPSSWARRCGIPHNCISCEDLSTIIDPLLRHLNIRYLKIGWEDGSSLQSSDAIYHCSLGVSIIKKILIESALFVEELHINYVPNSLNHSNGHDHGENTHSLSLSKYFFDVDYNPDPNNFKTHILFPKLKILSISESFDELKEHLVEELFHIAPNIQHLQGATTPEYAKSVFQCGKVGCVREYYCMPGNILCVYAEGGLNDVEAGNIAQGQIVQSLRLAEMKPRLQKLNISSQFMHRMFLPDPIKCFSQFTTIFKLLCESSCDTLEVLTTDQRDLIMLQRFSCTNEIPPMTHLKILRLTYIHQYLDSAVSCNLLQTHILGIDFSKFFPNLEWVTLHGLGGGAETQVSQPEILDVYGSHFLPRQINTLCEYYCNSVTHLEVTAWILYNFIEDTVDTSSSYSKQAIITLKEEGKILTKKIQEDMHIFYRKKFPNVIHFTLHSQREKDGLKKICKYLWSTWLNLETMTIKYMKPGEFLQNFDSDFMGISYQNVCEMKNSKDLKDYCTYYEQVKDGPSICNLNKLKHFKIEISHNSNWIDCCGKYPTRTLESYSDIVRHQSEPEHERFLSITAATCTIAQMPGLTMEVVRHLCSPPNQTKCRMAIDHLSPFVKFSIPN